MVPCRPGTNNNLSLIMNNLPSTTAPATLAKIVATIGPASESVEMIERLIASGVSVFRFNFSHGSFEDHAKRLSCVREISARLDRPVACLGDLQGPKIRVGRIPLGIGEPARSGGGSIFVQAGQDVILKSGITDAIVRQDSGGQEVVLPLTYQRMVTEVLPGHRVLINDGAIRMIAVDRAGDGTELRCRVTVGGLITSGKGINLPQTDISAPAITERDWQCVAWAVEHDLDYLALSFVRKAEEVRELKSRIETMSYPSSRGSPAERAWIPIVSKIEKPQALANLDSIVEASDAIMVARGDLGVEMDIARVPVAQKEIIATCSRQGKPCIVATQMLETMIDNASPTRAEASDVANAIFDGADAVMLSAETATGKHPALVVETMARIVAAAEQHLRDGSRHAAPPTRIDAAHLTTASLAHGAWQVAKDLSAKVVVCWSQNAGTARYLSQNNFRVPIIACSSDPRSVRRMSLYNGVTPVRMDPPPGGVLSDWHRLIDRYLLTRELAKPGDSIVCLAGRPLGTAKATNTIAVHVVRDERATDG